VTIKLLHEELKNKDVASSNEDGPTFVACTSKTMFHNSSIDQKLNIKMTKRKTCARSQMLGIRL
jgi:hypothetical protein